MAPTNTRRRSTLCVAADVRTHVRRDGSVVLEDRAGGNRYRLGTAEYRFFASLRSGRPPEEALRAAQGASAEWNAETAGAMVNWMLHSGVASLNGHRPPEISPPDKAARAWWNPLIFRVGFGSPEPLLQKLAPVTRYTSGSAWAWLAAAVVAAAALLLLQRWDDFAVAWGDLVSPWRLSTVVIAWIVLRLVHEFGHAIACHRLGGEVSNAGCLFIVGAPLTFVDVSSSVAFPARRQRIAVALAGVIAEVIVGAALVVAWAVSPGPFTHRLAADTLTAIGVGALVFNLNPLMKFDGYYVLLELSGAENLYERGSAYVGGLLRRVAWPKPKQASAPVDDLAWPLKLYGLASAVWRMFVVGCLVTASVHCLGLLGAVFAGALIAKLMLAPLLRGALTAWRAADARARLFAVARCGSAGAVAVLAGLAFPAPRQPAWPAIVELTPPHALRCGVAGFLERTHVEPGQFVRAGEPIVTLFNDELRLAARRGAVDTDRLELLVAAARSRRDASVLAELESELTSQREHQRLVHQRVSDLCVVAPRDGVYAGVSLVNEIGSYRQRGDRVGQIAARDAKGFVAMVDQDHADSIQPGQQVEVRTVARQAYRASVISIDPRIVRDATESDFGATRGGPLAVIEDASSYRFERPQRRVRLAPLDAAAAELRLGQRAWIAVPRASSLLGWIAERFASWGTTLATHGALSAAPHELHR